MPNTNGYGPKRAILYARVSTDEQARSGYSLAQQLEALRAYCVHEGLEVLEEVTDPGQSGASLERPGMDRVRELVSPEVAARLDPAKCYGLWWWGRSRISRRQVSEPGPG